MNKQALSLAVFVAGGAYPAVSNALSLGDIESNSNLNQPLKAQIELLSANAQEAQQLQVRLAPPSVFNRVGIDRPAYLENLRFSTTVKNGKPVIVVSSDVPIEEPYVNFLVEVSWPQGQLLKEYTVMLDPPVLMQPGNTVASEASVRAEPSAAGRVTRPAPQPSRVVAATPQPRPVQQAAAQPRPAPQPRQEPAPQPEAQPQSVAQPAQAAPTRRQNTRRTYRVRSGDTLYKIADRVKPQDLTTDQMMMALYRANPNAFIKNNINGLKQGAVLRAPTLEQARTTAPTAARQQVRQQYNDWKEFRTRMAGATTPQQAVDTTQTQAATKPETKPAKPPKVDKPRLEVLGSSKQPTTAGTATAAAGQVRLQELEKQLSLTRESISARQRENDELRSRLTDLESVLDKKNRLVAMGNTQMSDLQNSMGNKPAGTAQTSPTTPTLPANTTTPSNTLVPPVTTTGQVPSMQAGMPTIPTVNGTGTLPTMTPTLPAPTQTTTLPPMTPAPTGTDIQNAVGSLAANQTNTISRTEPPVPQQVTTPVQPQPKPVPTEAPASPFAGEEEGNDLMSMLTSPLAFKIGGGALGGLLLLALLSRFLGRRRKKVSDTTETIFDLDDDVAATKPSAKGSNADIFANLEDDLNHAEKRQDTPPVREAAVSGTVWEGAKSADPSLVVTKQVAPAEEEDDVLMESNVYIAYGLHQQAESELKKAIEKYPQRLEYRHKLLENYFAANNRAAFDQTAQEFMEQTGTNKQKLWNDITVWGRKISPDNPLYGTGAAPSVEPSMSHNPAPVAAKVAATAGSVAVASAALKAGEDEFDDYDLDLPDLDMPRANVATNQAAVNLDKTSAAPASARTEPVMTAPVVSQEDFEDFDFDLDFDEKPTPAKANDGRASNSMLDDLESLDFDTDISVAPKPVAKATEAQRGLSTLLDEIDLGADKAKDALANAGVATAAAVAGAGALAAGALANSKETVKAEANQLSSFMESDDDEFDELNDLLSQHNVSLPGAATTNNRQAVNDLTSKVTNLELHIKDDDLNKILPENNFYTKSSNNAAVSTVTTAKPQEEEWLGDIDDALSFLDLPDEEIDLHEAHISTKLDLARAYLDMGDIEGARSTLEEVVVEGNDDQRREAQRLLHQAG